MDPVISPFDLPDRLAAKADPRLVSDDVEHFRRVEQTLERTIAALEEHLAATMRLPGGAGQAAVDRDDEINRVRARLRTLRRYGLDLALGHMVPADGSPTVHVGRLGLTGDDGERLMVDWRSPVAEPFFGATHAEPMGLASRRRYRWTRGRITDYWDEVFSPDGLAGHAVSLDDQSAFVASLGASRSPRMRDVLGTIQADQDAIIRAGSRGALVVDGGPGTGKTVVALHRTAYLLYSDPRLGERRGGVLFVGPHHPYLAYVGDVLPSLGEDGVRTCTVRDMVPEGATAPDEPDPEVARLKSRAEIVDAIEPAVALYEEPPTTPLAVDAPWRQIVIDAADWDEAFHAPDPTTPHNEARDEVWEALCEIVEAKHDEVEGVSPELLRRALRQDEDLADVMGGAWPLLEATDVVSDLWSVPAYLRRCAPWLSRDEVRLLQRDDATAWTSSDLPLLDAARRRLGDPDAVRRRRRNEAAEAADRAAMDLVVDDLVAADDDKEGLVTQLRHAGMRTALVDTGVMDVADRDELAGPFAHVVVDEAQELTDAEWRMVLARCPSRSLTIVGDRAQARRGFTESWPERLARLGIDDVTVAGLTVNYRTPGEVMDAAEPVIRAVLPDANVPTSIRSSGVPVHHGALAELDDLLRSWLAEPGDGVACVIASEPLRGPWPDERVRALTPTLAKGLEFDLVVLVDPETFGDGFAGAVDRYVAMTRATQRLVVLTR